MDTSLSFNCFDPNYDRNGQFWAQYEAQFSEYADALDLLEARGFLGDVLYVDYRVSAKEADEPGLAMEVARWARERGLAPVKTIMMQSSSAPIHDAYMWPTLIKCINVERAVVRCKDVETLLAAAAASPGTLAATRLREINVRGTVKPAEFVGALDGLGRALEAASEATRQALTGIRIVIGKTSFGHVTDWCGGSAAWDRMTARLRRYVVVYPDVI